MTQQEWDEYVEAVITADPALLDEEEKQMRSDIIKERAEQEAALQAEKAKTDQFNLEQPVGSWGRMVVERGAPSTAVHAIGKFSDLPFVPMRALAAQGLHSATLGQGAITSPSEVVKAMNPASTDTYPSMIDMARRSKRQFGGWGEATSGSLSGGAINMGLDVVAGTIPGGAVSKGVSLLPKTISTGVSGIDRAYRAGKRIIDPAMTVGETGETLYRSGIPGLRQWEMQLSDAAKKTGSTPYEYGSRTREVLDIPGVWGTEKSQRSALADEFRRSADISRGIEQSTVKAFPGVRGIDLNLGRVASEVEIPAKIAGNKGAEAAFLRKVEEKNALDYTKELARIEAAGFNPFEAAEVYRGRLIAEGYEPAAIEGMVNSYLASFANAKRLPREGKLVMGSTDLPSVQEKWANQAAEAASAYRQADSGTISKMEAVGKRRAAETTREGMKDIVSRADASSLPVYEKALGRTKLADETLGDIMSSSPRQSGAAAGVRTAASAAGMGIAGAGPFATGTYLARRFGEGAITSPALTTSGKALYELNRSPYGRALIQSAYMQGWGALDNDKYQLRLPEIGESR